MKANSLIGVPLILVEAEGKCRTDPTLVFQRKWGAHTVQPHGNLPGYVNGLKAQAEARPVDLRQVQVARGALLRRRY